MNKQLIISSRNNRVVCDCPNDQPHQLRTKEGLAMSPSQISEAVSRGVAVSSQINEALFYDGDSSRVIDVPLERVRGIDVAEVWERQQTAKKKLFNAHLKDVEIYGN